LNPGTPFWGGWLRGAGGGSNRDTHPQVKNAPGRLFWEGGKHGGQNEKVDKESLKRPCNSRAKNTKNPKVGGSAGVVKFGDELG